MGRFLINEWQKGTRMKRGGGTFTDSLDALIAERGEASYLEETSHNESPEKLYQRVWAETMLSRAVDRLGRECAERGVTRFDVLRRFLSAGEEPPALAEAAVEFGMSLAGFKSLLHRFRQRYRELLLEEVGQTVGSAGDVAEELRGLLAALRG